MAQSSSQQAASPAALISQASHLLNVAYNMAVAGSSLGNLLHEHPAVFAELVKGKKPDGSQKADVCSFAKCMSALLELRCHLEEGGYMGAQPVAGTIVPVPIVLLPPKIVIPEKIVKSVIPVQEAVVLPPDSAYGQMLEAAIKPATDYLNEVLQPSVELLRGLKRLMLRVLQVVPLFVICSVLTWVAAMILTLKSNPEITIDWGWQAFDLIPSYLGYVAQRMAARFFNVAKSRIRGTQVAENDYNQTAAVEHGAASESSYMSLMILAPLSWWLRRG